ncbi:MAG TPA: hypothetical protein VFB72_18455 [Verrucomicrobiae bacterium]|nr:hypothetical protein [Verrucomicrobiae bacterium]
MRENHAFWTREGSQNFRRTVRQSWVKIFHSSNRIARRRKHRAVPSFALLDSRDRHCLTAHFACPVNLINSAALILIEQEQTERTERQESAKELFFSLLKESLFQKPFTTIGNSCRAEFRPCLASFDRWEM